MSQRAITAEHEGAFRDLYESGETVKALATRYGCTTRVVRLTLDRLRIERRWHHRPSQRIDRRSEVCALARAQVSQVEIARRTGIRQSVVGRILAQEGIHNSKGRRRAGSAHPAWKGGRYRTQGYWMVRLPTDSPFLVMANNQGCVLEHRFVMAQQLGRPLLSSETVHHKNGRRDDNRPENLQLRQGNHGKGAAYMCVDCGSSNIQPVSLD